MKIGYVLNQFPKLSESFITTEIAVLIDKGHEVSIFSINQAKETVTQREVKDYKLLNRTQYSPTHNRLGKTLKTCFNCLGSFGWSYPAETFATKLSTIYKSKHFSKNAANLDVLHAHFNSPSTHVAMLMSKKLGIPFTFTVHAFDLFVNPNVKVLKKRVEEAKAVVAISNFNKQIVCNLTGIEPEKVHVIRACPMLNKFKAVKSQNGSFTAVTVARLVEKKGIKYAILAIKELVKDYPNIQYNIVGSGPLEGELRALVGLCGLEQNVAFLGHLDDESLIEELRRATMFILPCICTKNGDMDGIPVSLMEAMYLELPVISTKISGIPELIEDNQEGILIKPKDCKQLSDAIKTLLDNEKMRIKLGKNGKKKIETTFNINTETAKLVDVWKA